MLKRFFPNEYINSIFDISYKSLMDNKIKGLIFDVDNTLMPYDMPHPSDEVIALFEKLHKMGFKISLLSNNGSERLLIFNERLNLFAVPKAKKPGVKGAERALAVMGVEACNAALIGDQVFTDIWCGNNCGMYTILVKPISKREEFFIKPKRMLEHILLRFYKAEKKPEKSNIAIKMKKEYNKKGFTLIEIIVAMAVTALFSGTVLLASPDKGTRVLDEVCRTLQADLRLAQRLSVIEGQRYGVRFDTAENMYEVVRYITVNATEKIKERRFDNDIQLVYLTGNTTIVKYTPTGTTGDACTVTLKNKSYMVYLTINVGSGRIDIKEFIKI